MHTSLQHLPSSANRAERIEDRGVWLVIYRGCCVGSADNIDARSDSNMSLVPHFGPTSELVVVQAWDLGTSPNKLHKRAYIDPPSHGPSLDHWSTLPVP